MPGKVWELIECRALVEEDENIEVMHVLLIEDERHFAHLLARRLNDAGYKTALAFGGPKGLERASSRGWDLAILDVMLPAMDGMTLANILRERGFQVSILMLAPRAMRWRIA